MKLLDYPHAGSPLEAVVCMGVFDGVHLGHQAVIGRAVAEAEHIGVVSAVVTFDRDPEQILVPERHVPQICTLDQKLRFVARLGPGCALVLPFDEPMAQLSPGDFLGRHLLATFQPRCVVVGENFHFGARGQGDVNVLRAYGEGHGFDVEALPLLSVENEPVSSTRIRLLLEAGRVAEAAALLGRPFAAEGTVVAGTGRGRAVGFHTANVAVPQELAVPAMGVYAGSIVLDDRPWPAAINVGTRPTFETAGEVWVEVHVIGLDADLYGRDVEVAFLEYLRRESRFADADTLRRQLTKDVEQAAAIFERSTVRPPAAE